MVSLFFGSIETNIWKYSYPLAPNTDKATVFQWQESMMNTPRYRYIT